MWEFIPDSKVHGANMGPIWGRQDPGGSHVGPINFAIWDDIIEVHFHSAFSFRILCTLYNTCEDNTLTISHFAVVCKITAVSFTLQFITTDFSQITRIATPYCSL